MVMAGNARRLGLDQVEFQCLYGCGSPSEAADDAGSAAQWRALVEVSWRSSTTAFPAGVARMPINITISHGGTLGEQRGALRGLGTGGDRLPLWLLERVTVRSSGSAVVVAGPGRIASRLLRQAQVAVTTVRKVLPRWRGPVVIEAPRNASSFARMAAVPPAHTRTLAAVTAPPWSPDLNAAHVYVNPRTFGTLGPVGKQVVLAHEVTHVAVRAAGNHPSAWLREGFADYVALDGVELPVRTLAAEARALVRAKGPPRHLPNARQLAVTCPDVGAWYEASWLAARLIAERYGAARLVAFYRLAARRRTSHAFRVILGTTKQEFEHVWRRHLAAVAR